jgi:hypothetical protein
MSVFSEDAEVVNSLGLSWSGLTESGSWMGRCWRSDDGREP